MKKTIMSLLVLAASVNIFALDITAKAKITLTSSSDKVDEFFLIQASDLNEGFNGSYCAEVMELENKVVAVYAYVASTAYATYGTKTVSEMALGIKTNADTQYTLSFDQVVGTITIYDAVTGQTKTLTTGGSYNFTATANQNINDRFILNPAAPSAPSICHQYGKLAITGHNGETVSIKEMDGSATSIEDRTLTEDYVEIDLAALNGKYRVTVGTETFVINTNPTVVPENN